MPTQYNITLHKSTSTGYIPHSKQVKTHLFTNTSHHRLRVPLFTGQLLNIIKQESQLLLRQPIVLH